MVAGLSLPALALALSLGCATGRTAERICKDTRPLPVASEAGYWGLHAEYGKEAKRVYDTFTRMTWFFKPYDVADFARLHRLTRFFRFAWRHAMDAFVADGLLTTPLHQNDVIAFCKEIQALEVFIQAEWCLSVMLLSQSIEEVSTSLVEALAVVGATPQNRTLAIANSLANNTISTDEFSYLYISLTDKPFNVIPTGDVSFDNPFLLHRTRELVSSSSMCDYLKEAVKRMQFKATPLAADPLSGKHELGSFQEHCNLPSPPLLDQEVSELDVQEIPHCLALDSQNFTAKLLLIPVNPVIPPPLTFLGTNLSSDEAVLNACSLTAVVSRIPRGYEYHSFQTSMETAVGYVFAIRRDFAFLNEPQSPERVLADWLVNWAHHPLKLFLNNGLRLRTCVDHELLADPLISEDVKVEALRSWLGETSGWLGRNLAGKVAKEDTETVSVEEAFKTCVVVHRRAVVKEGSEDVTHLETKEWRECAQACAKQDECKMWTFDPLEGGGQCWYWQEKEPEFVVDEKFWLTGNWTCSLEAARARRLLSEESLFASGQGISERLVLTYFSQSNVPGLEYLLGDRGRCANNGECECFPPYRGPLCAAVDAGKKDKERDYNAVLHYLTSDSDTDVFELKNSLKRLFQFFNHEADYPVVIFHDGLSPEHRKEIALASENRVWFAFVEDFISVPTWITRNLKYQSRLGDIRWSLGYRGMCRFRSGPIFDQPVLEKVDYAMTLDTDGYLPDFLEEDPIAKLHAAEGVYSYSHILDDQPAAVEHFFEHVHMFMRDRNIHASSLPLLQPFMAEGKWNMRLYMNDIEVMKLSWFRGPQYRDFFNYLDAFGGWWLHRWGDHAVRTFAIGMWLQPHQLLQMDIPYGHQSYCKCSRKNFVCVKEHKLDLVTSGASKFFVCVEP